MQEIGIGIVGGGYMGKAHAVAMAAVGAAFTTKLRPRLEMVAATSSASAERYRSGFGFARATDDWRILVSDDRVDAVIIASPPDTHREIALAAFNAGKHVFCEKPLGRGTDDGAAMVAAANANPNLANMVGFNYIRTPASQFVYGLLQSGEIGDITYFRAEMNEDFAADADAPWTWRSQGEANGALGDLSPHVFNMALRLMGPIDRLIAEIQTLYTERQSDEGMKPVTNDDRGQLMCEFESGVRGHIAFNRAATGRKMGYAYEIFGTKGSIRFDQEDQNAVWLYKTGEDPAQSGYRKILTGPAHPDYVNFNLGPGHGTGYQDQIIIEARDFLKAIETGEPVWPTFKDGQDVNNVISAIRRSNNDQRWVGINEIKA